MTSSIPFVQPRILHEQGSHMAGDKQLMQDYLCWSLDESNATLSVTVGDMASNHTGTTYRDTETAAHLGIDAETSFNGGLIGRVALERGLEGSDATGAELVSFANAVVRTAHERAGVDWQNGAERFTGYLAHTVITPEWTYLTTVGDVYTWVNGECVAGVDNPLGPVIGLFITDCAQNDPQKWEQLVASTKDKIDLDEVTADALLGSLVDQSAKVGTAFTRQDSYIAASKVLIPWYMNRLQNTTDHRFSYGAIDGTSTPEEFIQVRIFPTTDIDSLVIATDGLKPHKQGAGVHGLGDLVPSNPVYGEQTAIDLQPAAMLGHLMLQDRPAA